MGPEPRRAPSSATKKALIVLAALAGAGLLGCLVCGVSGWLWVQDKAGEMREMGVRVGNEATEFAASHAQADCLDESFRRSEACGSPAEIMCHAEVNAFLRFCLAAASTTPGLCDGVPPADDIVGSAQWAGAHCAELGRAQDPSCPRLVSGLVYHCAPAE